MTPRPEWLRTRAAEDYLSRSKRTLQRYIDRGLLEPGVHYLKSPSESGRGHWLWNAQAIQEVLIQQSINPAPVAKEAE
ncbi:helix-turn-helix domain-containing protein [Synechococcus sp. AH-224-I15]|nr:helix-turn-helix domain-containing protein [Synechococcus sp. AH-224-I15]